MFNDSQNDTARIPTTAPQVSAQEQLRQITHRINDLHELLRGQREILRQRGMDLPPGAMDGLRTMRAHLEQLASETGSGLSELAQLRALAETGGLINSSLDPADV